MTEAALYLASRSPRRAELLRQIGVAFEAIPADIPEQARPGESPRDFVARVAAEKALAILRSDERVLDLPVLGADTEVVVDDDVMGKPRDRADAVAMLARLSGRMHLVLSAVTVVDGDRRETVMNETRVWFRRVDEAECNAYWDTGEPAGKAGAYAIQGRGAVFVERIEGSYSGVMGLPQFETARLLDSFGVKAGL